MTVAMYARVSSESQEARGSIGSQLEALRRKMAELMGDLLLRHRRLAAVSGSVSRLSPGRRRSRSRDRSAAKVARSPAGS
jgi:hypothetical protein